MPVEEFRFSGVIAELKYVAVEIEPQLDVSHVPVIDIAYEPCGALLTYMERTTDPVPDAHGTVHWPCLLLMFGSPSSKSSMNSPVCVAV
jgi:hypothetical protein